jgi:RNA polymerase sigma factor (sigma-70 family)
MTQSAMHDENANTNNTASKADSGNNAPIDINDLYRKHRVHIFRFVQRYIRNAEDAEDIVQNTFLEAVRCADRFSGLSKPSTWLFGIALNLSRNRIRNAAQQNVQMVDELLMEQLIDMRADPVRTVEIREIASKVESLLGELQPSIRSTFEAIFEGDATYAQAAETLHIPIGTVRSRVSRVRAAIRAECEGRSSADYIKELSLR